MLVKTFARTTQVTIPSILLPLGTFIRTSPALPSDADNVQLILQQGADFIGDGSQVFTLAIDYAADGTNFSLNLLNDGATDTPVPAHLGRPAGQMSWGTNIPDVGSATRKIRFTLNVQERRTVSGSLDVF